MEFEIKINEKLSLKLRNAENAEAFLILLIKIGKNLENGYHGWILRYHQKIPTNLS